MNSLNQKDENFKSLTNLLGLKKEVALDVLNAAILITNNLGDEQAETLKKFVKEILQKTVSVVTDDGQVARPVLEIVINEAQPRSMAQKLYIYMGQLKLEIVDKPSRERNPVGETRLHQSLILLGACYVSALTLKKIVPGEFSIPVAESIELRQDVFFRPNFDMSGLIDIGETYIAGAGAVGNSFLFALQLFNVTGKINIADPDSVSSGNLNRCVFFESTDVGKNKAEQLREKVEKKFSHIQFEAFPEILQSVLEKKTEKFPLQRLVVAVDSKRVRRNLQLAFPKEVYDASTTGLKEVVLHFNNVLSNKACLSCIYYEDQQEKLHEAHIAESLGVSIEDVGQNFISQEAAIKIHKKYTQCDPTQIQGQAYDSLFKALCGQGQLLNSSDRQVVAPLAFVSVLAGVCLAIEFVQRVNDPNKNNLFNYWRLSPWNKPMKRLQQVLGQRADCEFCSKDAYKKLISEMASLENF